MERFAAATSPCSTMWLQHRHEAAPSQQRFAAATRRCCNVTLLCWCRIAAVLQQDGAATPRCCNRFGSRIDVLAAVAVVTSGCQAFYLLAQPSQQTIADPNTNCVCVYSCEVRAVCALAPGQATCAARCRRPPGTWFWSDLGFSDTLASPARPCSAGCRCRASVIGRPTASLCRSRSRRAL